MPGYDEVAVALGEELGAQAARIERDLKLAFAHETERLRADRAEFELRIERAVAERLAALKDGPPGPPGEAAPMPELHAPDDLAPLIGKAIGLLAAPGAAPSSATTAPVVNVTVPPARTERIRVVKHDDKGRILEIERGVA